MPDGRRTTCRECGRKAGEVGPISWSGKCIDCGKLLLKENVLGLHFHTGEPMARWRRGVAASVGAVLPEDLDALAGQD